MEEEACPRPKREDMRLEELEFRLGSVSLDTPTGKCHEGSDSGVEVNFGIPQSEMTPVASCDSSLLSCCYSSEDLVSQTLLMTAEEREHGDGTSEGGSESSSVASNKPKSSGSVRKKCVIVEKCVNRPSRMNSSSMGSRCKTPHKDRSLSRTPSSTRNTPVTNKTPIATPKSSSSLQRSVSVRIPTEQLKSSAKNLFKTKSPQVSNTDDGRWPSSVKKITSFKSVLDKKSSPMTSSVGPMESKSTTFDKYATLPRRRRRSAENLLSPTETKVSVSREPSLNRTASLRRQKNAETISPTSGTKTMPPYPKKQRSKTRIFHETSVQTAWTGQDVELALAGSPPQDVHSRVETKTASVQADRRFEVVEKLEQEIKLMEEKMRLLTDENTQLAIYKSEFNKERSLRQESETRIRSLLKDRPMNEDLLGSLESHVHQITDICKKQQSEISHLQGACCKLKAECERSQTLLRKYMQEQQEVEAESLEIQEFLQAEKSTLAESLKEAETEVLEAKNVLDQKEAEIAKQKEECTHLVRMCEQRRQEIMSLEAKLRAVELWSKETMIHHGAAVSGASVALTGLGNRLETLVDALVTSYNISPNDLEDVIFHNEVYNQSSSSSESSTEATPEKKPKKQGFMAALLNAIRAATHTSTPEMFSDGEMLSAEPEPIGLAACNLTCNSSPGEGKRHSIASLPSLSDMSPTRHSHRASFAASEDFDVCLNDTTVEGVLTNSESLQNLSEAIFLRQKQEKEVTNEYIFSKPSTALVDQVIEVDNLVTKVLKVIRLIQVSTEKVRCDNGKEEATSDERTSVLKAEIADLQEKLKLGDKSSHQVEVLSKALKEKELALEELQQKFHMTQELLTSNWHKAMSEVRRQYETIDSALEMLQSLQNENDHNPILLKLQKELEDTNFHVASTLPVSTSEPDLNANAAVTLSSNNGTIN